MKKSVDAFLIKLHKFMQIIEFNCKAFKSIAYYFQQFILQSGLKRKHPSMKSSLSRDIAIFNSMYSMQTRSQRESVVEMLVVV